MSTYNLQGTSRAQERFLANETVFATREKLGGLGPFLAAEMIGSAQQASYANQPCPRPHSQTIPNA